MVGISLVLALLAAAANAASNVLQRKANRQAGEDDEFSLRLLLDLLHRPVWLAGIATVVVSFLLQAAALGTGRLAVVEPLIVLELPMTLIAGQWVFGSRLRRREWTATAVMTLGLAGLIGFLDPQQGKPLSAGGVEWAVALTATAGVLLGLVALGRRHRHEPGRQAALLGTASGVGFGITAALTKGATAHLSGGVAGLFTAWQTYLLVVAGLGTMWLLQQALHAGRLVAAQPGITLADPFVSILWGAVVFGEQTNGGVFLFLAAVSALVLAGGALALSRSPQLQGDEAATEDGDAGGPDRGRDGPKDRVPATVLDA